LFKVRIMRKITIAVILGVLYTSCSTVEEDNRICLDWESREVIKEKCVPMYGALICADEVRVEHRCILWEEIEDEVLLNKS